MHWRKGWGLRQESWVLLTLHEFCGNRGFAEPRETLVVYTNGLVLPALKAA